MSLEIWPIKRIHFFRSLSSVQHRKMSNCHRSDDKFQARVDGHLSSPTAIELLHHLFPPLAILLDESHELFDVDLVKDISCPMLTRKAVDMVRLRKTHFIFIFPTGSRITNNVIPNKAFWDPGSPLYSFIAFILNKADPSPLWERYL